MSRRDDDGGNETTSESGDEYGVGDPSGTDELSDWVDETAAFADASPAAAEAGGSSEDSPAKSGWLGRVFARRGRDDDQIGPETGEAADSDTDYEFEPENTGSGDSESAYDPRSGADPDALSVFSAVVVGGATSDDAGSEEEDEPNPAEPADTAQPDATAGPSEHDEEVSEDAVVVEMPERAPEPGQATFGELWGSGEDDSDDDDSDDDIVDFATFTSEDYLQATTREYAGLAEAVARAEEEDTQRIAVSAEIPGLESGIVGLDDVVGTAGGNAAAEVVEPPGSSDLPIRVLTALGLVALFAASLLSPFGIGALIVVVLGIAAGEMFAALIRGGYRPLSIFGFAGVAGAFFGTWAAGPIAIPISLLLAAIAVFLFYATVPGRRAVVENATLTILVTAWIGGLGGFAFDFLGSPDYYWLVLALVVTVAIMDIAQYFIGRRFGRRPLAPVVSPKKTIEGYVAGIIVAVGVGAAFALAEPFELRDGLIIGAVIAVVAPFGDLAVSVVKRSLGVKDMGYILPGHGGVLDRVDAMIVTIPALWLAFSWMGLLS